MIHDWLDKKTTIGNAAIAVCIAVLLAMVFGIWVGSPDDPPSPYGKNAVLMESSSYQAKYAREVCRQRNATPHFIVGNKYVVCKENGTGYLTDFD